MASEFEKTWQSVGIQTHHTHIPTLPPAHLSFFCLIVYFTDAMCSCRTALDIEKELFKTLAEKEPTFAGISHYLSLLVYVGPYLAAWPGFVAPLTMQVPWSLSGCYASRLRNGSLNRCGIPALGRASQDQQPVP